MEHTKGPWSATRWAIGDGWRVHVLHTADNDVHDAICDLDTWQSDDQTEANARLIAAAPELLEACNRCLDFINIHHTGTMLREMLETAIAKAEGRS